MVQIKKENLQKAYENGCDDVKATLQDLFPEICKENEYSLTDWCTKDPINIDDISDLENTIIACFADGEVWIATEHSTNDFWAHSISNMLFGDVEGEYCLNQTLKELLINIEEDWCLFRNLLEFTCWMNDLDL